MKDVPPTPIETLTRFYEIAREELRYVYVGNVGDPRYETTYCPNCGAPVVIRHGYYTDDRTENGRCPHPPELNHFLPYYLQVKPMTSLAELRKKVMEKTKKRVEEAYTEKDRYIIQAIEALDDLDAVYNLLVERLREWYGLHFPETNQLVHGHRPRGGRPEDDPGLRIPHQGTP